MHAERYDGIIVQLVPAEFMRMGQAQNRGPGSPTAVLGRGDHSEVPDFFPKCLVSIFQVVLPLTLTSAGNRRPLSAIQSSVSSYYHQILVIICHDQSSACFVLSCTCRCVRVLSFISFYYIVTHFPLRGSAKLSTTGVLSTGYRLPRSLYIWSMCLSDEGEC